MLDNESIRARAAEFDRLHGVEKYSDGQFYFFRDGAYRDVDAAGVLAPPPIAKTRHGQLQLATNILRFYQLRLKKAVAEYDELNTRLAHQLPTDEEVQLRRLRELQQTIDARNRDVEAAQAALDSTELMRQRKAMLQGQAEERQRFVDFQKKRAAIKV